MKVLTTLRQQYKTGTVSTWRFGQLANGKFIAKCLENGKVKTWTSLPQMDQYIGWLVRHGYTKPSPELVRQLALAV